MSKHDKYQSPINFKQLSYFLALAEHGSISAAASALNMAQPSLSENIAKLEKILDVQLAIRGSRGIQMTEAGAALARRGGEILNDLHGLVGEIQSITGEPRGPISIGLPPSLSCLLSVPLLETLHSEFPEVKVHIAEAMSGDILDWLANDRLDIGCVYEAYDSIPFTFEPILSEQLFLITAPDNWEGEIGPDGIAKQAITPQQLQSLPLVLTSASHGARKLQERYARASNIDYNVIAVIDSLPHMIEMVNRASAYTILSHGAVVHHVARGQLALVPIEGMPMQRTAYMVRKRSRPVSRACTIVEQTIATIIAEMVDRFGLRAEAIRGSGDKSAVPLAGDAPAVPQAVGSDKSVMRMVG